MSYKLHELKIGSAGHGGDQEDEEKKFADDEEIVDMRQQLTQQEKEFAALQERYRKINLVNDQVSGWSRRVSQKFAVMLGNQVMAQQDDLVKVFETMEDVTVKELKDLREKAEEQPLEPDDAFIDFATDDFINKNIRVRPISGATNLGGQQDRQSQISKNTANQDTEDAQESYQRLAEFEMENQRKLVKQKAAMYQEELRRKQAIEEKKNAKK